MEPDMDMERRDARGGEPTGAGAFDSEVLADAPLRADAADIRSLRAAVLREGSATGGRRRHALEREPWDAESADAGVPRRSRRRWCIAAVAIGAAVLGAATVGREPIERVVASARGAVVSAQGAVASARDAVPSVTDAVSDAEVVAPVEAVSSSYAASRLVAVQGKTAPLRVVPAAKVPKVPTVPTVPTVRVAALQPVRAANSVSRPRVASSSEPVRARIATKLRALEEYERTQANLQSTHNGAVPPSPPSPPAPTSTP